MYCRSRILKRFEAQKVNDRDRESSRIVFKNIANLTRKYKKRTRRIELLIKHSIPKPSSWHDLLSITFRNYFLQRQINTGLQYCKPPNCAKNNRISKCCNQGPAQNRTIKPNLSSKRSKLLLAPKCIIQRLETSYKYSLFLCGDIELNPGPVMNTSMSVLTARLARLGLMPINITGDGNCFFRSVSYQLYHTEDRHAQIRALAIQHLIICPEYFIESNTQQSWAQYLQDMSMPGTWADHIIIQAVANANGLRIHITESAQNFSESTVVSSVYAESGRNVRDIYIGHLDELHYVATAPTTQSVSQQVENGKANKLQEKPNLQISQTKSRTDYI